MGDWRDAQNELIADAEALRQKRNAAAPKVSPGEEPYSHPVVQDADAKKIRKQMKELRKDRK